MNPQYTEKAIPLISVDYASGRYVLTSEATEFLSSVPGPIGVVSVAGLYRTGKSYLLNQMLLNRSNGFGVGPTVNPCTKGLWCWGTPIKGQTAQGEKLNIIVIDTEGIGAPDEDQTHDARVFTLAILASSCFIYNSVGSIDETAVQNLSLIVNLTKHIQLRTNQSVDDQDPQKIANYFPSFFWVVRDFTLQIVDNDGNKLSSKQYLEKALAPHKGFTDDIEQKNRIRRLLTSFFKDRQCFTLVRPLIDQPKLQDLDKMNFEDLRPEFVNQVINFRKRIVSRMKPKVLNGQKLNGELYLNMLSSYVKAINEGAVPNIENAWNYMCQEQCNKVLHEAWEAFERELREIRIPCSADEISKGIQNAEEIGCQTFKAKSIGQDSERYLKELQQKMKQKTRELRQLNVDESKAAFKKYITPFVTSIQPKINKQQYSSVQQFLDELSKIQEKILKQGPNYVDSNLNCQIFIRKLINQGVPFLSKRMRNQKQQIKKSLEEKIKLFENQIQYLKKEKQGEEIHSKEKIGELDKEKIQFGFKIEKLEYELERVSRERHYEEELLNKNLFEKKLQIETIKSEQELKLNEANTKIYEITKDFHSEQSNWQKQKAIYQLKIKQQIEKIDELERRKQTFDSKLALETSQLMQKHRDENGRFNEQIDELAKNLGDTKQKYQELSLTNNQLNEKYVSLTQKYESTDRKLREETNSKMRQIQKIRNEHECQLNRVRNELLTSEDQKIRESRELEQKYRKQEQKTKQLYQQLTNIKCKYERENQILTQQLQFTKRSWQQTKMKMSEMKYIYQNRIIAMEEDNGLQREQQVKKKIDQMKFMHEQNLRNNMNEFREIENNLNFQIANLVKIRNQLQLKIKVSSQQLSNERIEHEQTKQNLVYKVQQLENQLKQVQRDRNTELLTKQGIFNDKIATLEKQLEQVRQNYHLQKIELESRVSNQITQIKNYYEMEREKQEGRHSEEKDKLKKKYNKTVEEYEKKLQEQSDNYQEELEKIESEYGNQVRTLSMALNEVTHEKDTLSRQRVALEDKLNSLSQKYSKMQSELNERLQRLMDSSRAEKQSLSKKLEDLKQLKNQMEKEVLSLTHERDQYRSQAQKQSSQIEQLKYQNTTLIQRFEAMKKTLQQKLKQVQSNYMRDKSKFETDIALLQQKKDFAEEKIYELEGQIKNVKEKEEETIRQIKEKYNEEIGNLNAKIVLEKKNSEEKFEKFKKQCLETENNLCKQLSEVSKAKAVDEQKIQYLEKKLVQSESKRQTQMQSASQQFRTLKQKTTTQKTQLKLKVDQLQQLLHVRQNQLTQLKNQYQIQIALADSKIKTQLQWSESIIAQKIEMIKNLQKQLDDSRKRNENEKSSQQLTHQEILSRMESKYRNQITQLNQDITKKTQEIEYMIKEHERVIKDLNEKLAIEKQTRISLETKITRIECDNAQKEQKLSQEIDKLRQEKQQQNFEVQKQLVKEKENCKVKLSDFEKKYIEIDKVKQQAIFEKEKQEAKWKMERNALQEKIQEIKDNLEKEKNENKKLMKDNQKLKAEKKKNNSFINLKNQTTFLNNRDLSIENKENAQLQ